MTQEQKDLTRDNAGKNTEDINNTDAPAQEEAVKEESIADVLGDEKSQKDTQKDKTEVKDTDTVSLSKYMIEKNKRKKLAKQNKELRDLLENDDDDVDDYSDTPDTSDLEQDVSKMIDDKLKPILSKAQQAERVDKFNKLLSSTLEAHPEYKDIVNVEVIKQLAFTPANSQKTMSQLLDSVYGHLVDGRPSIESDVPANNPTPGGIDYDKATTNTEYFNKIMADPKLKEEYNKNIQDRIFT